AQERDPRGGPLRQRRLRRQHAPDPRPEPVSVHAQGDERREAVMAKDAKEKEGGSTFVIALSALLALGAAGVVYYCYEESERAAEKLVRTKEEYKKMAQWK